MMLFKTVCILSCILGVFGDGKHGGIPLYNSYDFKIPATAPTIIKYVRDGESLKPAIEAHHHVYQAPQIQQIKIHSSVPQYVVKKPSSPVVNTYNFKIPAVAPLIKHIYTEAPQQQVVVKPHEIYGVPLAYQIHV